MLGGKASVWEGTDLRSKVANLRVEDVSSESGIKSLCLDVGISESE